MTTVARAPGRVNLIGEHTDYNDGLVLPMAIGLATTVTATPRADTLLRCRARAFDEVAEWPVGEVPDGPPWARYVAGCAALLGRPDGAELTVEGDLPLGAGLSSSASLEVGVLLALGGDGDRVALARLAQRVEHEVVGVRSGLMDQLAVALGRAGHALLVDCRSLEVDEVPVPEGVRVVVVDSGLPRTLAGSAYNQRRAECEAAAAALGVTSLRDADSWAIEPLLARRVRHVLTENARVLAAAAALRAGDVAEVGRLLLASHASLRDDYEVSSPGLDALVEVLASTPGVHGARLTGAGLGGCAIALADTDAADDVAASAVDRYRARTGHRATAWVTGAAAGAQVRHFAL